VDRPFRQDRAMPSVSTLFFAATAAAASMSASTYAPDMSQPAIFGRPAAVEKLYLRDGKVVATPVLDIAQAEERCPAGYVVRREDRVQRDAETWLVWQLICHPARRE
jgi:hypothetical protein